MALRRRPSGVGVKPPGRTQHWQWFDLDLVSGVEETIVEGERDVHHLQRALDWMDRTFASEAEPYDTVDVELQQLSAELLARKSS
ncbi:MAG: hypothetical protein M3137_07685 [Actinomycetota bacterium]|nr:hypothetical protein [Actinomycetota bacterium]